MNNTENYNDITDDFIFNLEILHDNKPDKKFIENIKSFNDIIRNKEVNIKKYNEPEQILKNLLFKNISYKQLFLKNEKFLNKLNFNTDDIILIFDNIQLRTKKYNIICDIIFKQKCSIFIPYVFLAEQSINHPIDIDNKINYFKRKYKGLVFFNNYKKNEILRDKYKKISEHIGLCFLNTEKTKIKLLNYNSFTHPFKKESIINELTFLKIYFDAIDKKSDFFINVLNKAWQEYLLYFITNNKLDKNKLNSIDVNIHDKIIEIKKLMISFKQARDSYYLIEILDIYEKNKNSIPVFITSDEITCIRCIMNNISSLNIYGENIRYLCYIKKENEQNKLYIKLFNVLHFLMDEYNDLINIYKNNVELITNTSESLITKIIFNQNGGYYMFNDNKMIVSNLIVEKKINHDNIIIELDEQLIITLIDKINMFHKLFFSNIFDFITNISTNNSIYTKALNDFKLIVQKIILIDKQYNINDYINLKFTNNTVEFRNFTSSMTYIYNNFDQYKNFTSQAIPKKLLLGWFLTSIIDSGNLDSSKIEYIEKYILNDTFDKYNLYLLMILFNIDFFEYRFTKYLSWKINFYSINVDDIDDENLKFNYEHDAKIIFDTKFDLLEEYKF